MKYCSIKDCDRKHSYRSYCTMHAQRFITHGDANFVKQKKIMHGMSKYPEYLSWTGMKRRCYGVNNPRYKDWGGRGIKVCDRWKNSFPNFLEDMGRKPTPRHTLDRIDNNKDYTPENCRWATYSEQNYNQGLKRNNTSGVTGVSWDKRKKVWVAYYFRKYMFFKKFEDAVKARKDLEKS